MNNYEYDCPDLCVVMQPHVTEALTLQDGWIAVFQME